MTAPEKLHFLVNAPRIGSEDGMPVACAVSLDNLSSVPQALLTGSITRLDD
jgi:hypothetical protein